MMNILKCYLEKHIGKPCPDYAPGCMSCSCWIAFAQLDEAFMDYEPKKAKKK